MSIMMHRRGVIAASIMKIGATQPPVGEDGTGITSWDWNDGKLATYQSVLHSTATAPVVEFPNGGVRLKLTDNGDGRIRLNPTLKLKDFDISFKMHIPSEAGAYVGIIYRTGVWLNSDSHHAYSLYMGPSGAYLAKGSNNADTVNWELVTSNATVLSPNSEHIVRLEVMGDKHTLYLNGNKWMTGTDAAFPDAGEIGLRFYATTANTESLVDDVSITSLDSVLIEDPTPADLHDQRGDQFHGTTP